MKNTLLMPFQTMDVYAIARELAITVHRSDIRDAELKDQATRASKSAFLQVAEGLPNYSAPMRRKYFVCARNSACEVAAAIDLALALGCVEPKIAERIARLAARLRAVLIGLLR